MRFKANNSGYSVYAISGVNTISFAIAVDGADTSGLLGFAVERIDPAGGESYFVKGFKVFESVIPQPNENTTVTTFEHPIQSFVWDDFTAKEGHRYRYRFHPLKGTPKNIDRSAAPVEIEVQTEEQFDSNEEHEVFFNRGVASSQIYTRRFGNLPPDKMPADKRLEALKWLGRELPVALLKFIEQAKADETLLCCFYEFRQPDVAAALKKALGKGVKVRLIVDAKVNESTDKEGKFHESFPRVDNLKVIREFDLKALGAEVILRESRTSAIQHNKFMVLLKGAGAKPAEVWTGSTNISQGGIYGQTNVGHWIRNASVAEYFRDYWQLLSSDPGAKEGDESAAVRAKNNSFKQSVEALLTVPEVADDIPSGTTPVFSPRRGKAVLEMYARLMDEADDLACVTLAFGINAEFKKLLKDNTNDNHIAFFLLEKKDEPNKRSTQPFIAINARNNVYKAWGSYLREPLHQWVKETSAGRMKLNTHVSFIHSKFMLIDPLGTDPIVITGSANFSLASTQENDENMLLIRGSQRVADIYFTEFNRLFNHYYFRSVMESFLQNEAHADSQSSLFLQENDAWLKKYKAGTFRAKRIQVFSQMKGFTA